MTKNIVLNAALEERGESRTDARREVRKRERGNTCVYAAFNFLFYICSTSRINTDVTVPMQQQFNVPALV